MLSVEEASTAILQRAEIRAATRRGIIEACGLVLAEDIASDVDSPPHDKAMVLLVARLRVSRAANNSIYIII